MIASSMAQEAQQALKLLQEYSFELGWYSAESQVMEWLQSYRATWIRDAVIEALYQGRYKAVSVKQILALWGRRGQPVRHFNREFETIVGRQVGMQLPSVFLEPEAPLTAGVVRQDTQGAASGPPQLQASRHETAAPLLHHSATDVPHDVAAAAELLGPNAQAAPKGQAPHPGTLYALHQPIQPFQPDLPDRAQPRLRSRPKPVGFGKK
jgi:hypothetical protein